MFITRASRRDCSRRPSHDHDSEHPIDCNAAVSGVKMLSALLGVLALLATACGSGAEPISASASSTSATSEPQISALGVAIDSIGGVRLSEARSAYLTDCLQTAGVPEADIAQYLANSQPVSQQGLSQEPGFGVTTGLGTSVDDLIADRDRLVASYQQPTSGTTAAGLSKLNSALQGSEGSPGCLSKAESELGAAMTGFLQELGPSLSQMEAAFQGDPRVQAFWQNWSQCMADGGYPAGSIGQIANSLTQDLNKIRAQIEIRPRTLAPGDYNLSEEERQRIVDGRVSQEIEQQLDELKAREIAAAELSASCGADPRDGEIPKDLVPVRLEYEAAFLDQHEKQVDQWVKTANLLISPWLEGK